MPNLDSGGEKPCVPVTEQKKLCLIDNWHLVLRKAWSIRLIILAAVLSGLEALMAAFLDNPPIARSTFALLFFFITASALIARIIAQR